MEVIKEGGVVAVQNCDVGFCTGSQIYRLLQDKLLGLMAHRWVDFFHSARIFIYSHYSPIYFNINRSRLLEVFITSYS